MVKDLELLTSTDTDFYFDEYEMGNTPLESSTVFRIFCPRARKLEVELFDSYKQKKGARYPMEQDANGVWNVLIKSNLVGKLYGYRITPPEHHGNDFIATDELVADPYSKIVTTRNTYRQEPKTLIVGEQDYDWEDDEFVAPDDHRDLIIYESHLKDLTAHASSKCKKPGTYKGLLQKKQKGGLAHLKELGVNAVEFFPLHKYAYFEPPFKEKTPEGYFNTWNPYERNYWGYMSSFYFVPETMFASDGSNKPDKIIGTSDKAIREYKDVIKSLHKEGISVIMDVVYNHVSQYDLNPFKFIDKGYYFRLDQNDNYITESGCGNDFRTEAPMAREMICDSIKYWMEEFHVDGFRFDLANLIDWDTVDAIRETARSINPNAILIAEPWGGGYDPTGFSQHDFAALNDQIRNGVKGSDPVHAPGFIFGKWQHETSRLSLENFVRGTLENSANGRFRSSRHSVNYLASHDGYTLGDFIRIAMDNDLVNQPVDDIKEIKELSEEALKIAKLGALYLFTSQGITLVHEGQPWAHSKIIRPNGANPSDAYQLDHNSYEKDNETNYLNFSDIKLNKELYNYYKGLIAFRKSAAAIRKGKPENIGYQYFKDALLVTFYVLGADTSDPNDYFVSLNGNIDEEQTINIPGGEWEVMADNERAGNEPIEVIEDTYTLRPATGVILRKLRD